MKLRESQVRRIVREKGRGQMTNAQTAQTMGVTVRRVQRLWARHRHRAARDVSHPRPMGRPKGGMRGRTEHSAVLSAHGADCYGAAALHKRIAGQTGINIPHGTIHRILKEWGLAGTEPKKGKRRMGALRAGAPQLAVAH